MGDFLRSYFPQVVLGSENHGESAVQKNVGKTQSLTVNQIVIQHWRSNTSRKYVGFASDSQLIRFDREG